jgi:hypothetical protein
MHCQTLHGTASHGRPTTKLRHSEEPSFDGTLQARTKENDTNTFRQPASLADIDPPMNVAETVMLATYITCVQNIYLARDNAKKSAPATLMTMLSFVFTVHTPALLRNSVNFQDTTTTNCPLRRKTARAAFVSRTPQSMGSRRHAH